MMERLTERINGKLKLKKQFSTVADTIDILTSKLEVYEDTDEQSQCGNCIWKNKRHQKCTCCKRNAYLKDNHEEARR